MPAPSAKLRPLRHRGPHCRRRHSAWGRRYTLRIHRRPTTLAMMAHVARPHTMTNVTPRTPRKTRQIPRNPLLAVRVSRTTEARIDVVVNVIVRTPREAPGGPLTACTSVGASDARLELATKTYGGYCCSCRQVCRHRDRKKRRGRRSTATNTLAGRGAGERERARRGPAAPHKRIRNRHKAR